MKRLFAALVFLFGLGGIANAQLFPVPMQACSNVGGCQLAGTQFSGVTISWQTATAARYLMVFDANTAPSNGSTTACSTTQANGCLSYCLYVPTSTSAPNALTLDYTLHPILERNGVYIAMSTGAGCGTFTQDTGSDYFYSQNR